MQILPQQKLESSTHMGQCKVIQSLFNRINRFGATASRICTTLRRGDSPSPRAQWK
jgi:hypothetical protein